jgi:hypothetical protein
MWANYSQRPSALAVHYMFPRFGMDRAIGGLHQAMREIDPRYPRRCCFGDQ